MYRSGSRISQGMTPPRDDAQIYCLANVHENKKWKKFDWRGIPSALLLDLLMI